MTMTSLFVPADTKTSETLKMKLAILGDKQVGKTSLLNRYVKNSFSHTYLHTTGGDISEITVDMKAISLHVSIIDSSGYNLVGSLFKTLYRNVHGIMLVYDVTRENTFKSLDEWQKEITNVNISSPIIMLVGNKTDLDKYRTVPSERAELYAQKKELAYKEVSAKAGCSVHEAFTGLIEDAFKEKFNNYQLSDSIKLTWEQEKNETNKKFDCCS